MANSHRYALVLAGGRGTRFWPLSRKRRAKQVLDFLGEGSLIRQTVERIEPLVPRDRIWILTNDLLRDEIARQLPGVPKRQIVAEPVGRNTAPAIGLAAKILAGIDPEAVLGVFPADQYVARPEGFRKLVEAAYKAAEQGQMALIGIRPRSPETGFGYLEFPEGGMKAGSLKPAPVVRFREKPGPAEAEEYVRRGHFAWNAGMFFWRADVFLGELRKHLPRTAALLDSLPAFGSRQFAARLVEVFPQCENISVDYAVLEKTSGVVGLAAGDIGWSDVGSWSAVYELARHDGDGNTSRGSMVALGSRGNLVDAPGKLVALVGVEDLVVVDTGDALLICPRARAQSVGDAVRVLEKIGRDDLL
jgi:mannose-1-phosphate guanylyltransferase